MDPPSFIEELKRRKVVRAATVYGAVVFVVVEVADLVFPALGFPDWTYSFVVVLVLLGFPVALALSWAFDLTPDGVKRAEAIAPEGASGEKRAEGWLSMRTAILALVLVFGGWMAGRVTGGDGGWGPRSGAVPRRRTGRVALGGTLQRPRRQAGLPTQDATVRYLLDTNVLSDPARPAPDPRVVEWLRDPSPLDLAISVLVLGEIANGVALMAPGRRKEALTEWLEQDLGPRFRGRVLPIDDAVDLAWGRLAAHGRRVGRELPVEGSPSSSCPDRDEINRYRRS